jgi:hypothetical protein
VPSDAEQSSQMILDPNLYPRRLVHDSSKGSVQCIDQFRIRCRTAIQECLKTSEDVDELEKAWSTWLCFGTSLHLDLVVLWGTSKASKAPFTFRVTSRRNHNIQLCLLWKLVPVTLSLPCTESLLLPKGATQS